MEFRLPEVRWLMGDAIPGVTYAVNTSVRITKGDCAGQTGTLLALMEVEPEPLYWVVDIGPGGRDALIPQSLLGTA